ncbi:MAG: hypothetical protein ABEN55_04045 [Bradymonadaceae bacterium]
MSKPRGRQNEDEAPVTTRLEGVTHERIERKAVPPPDEPPRSRLVCPALGQSTDYERTLGAERMQERAYDEAQEMFEYEPPSKEEG